MAAATAVLNGWQLDRRQNEAWSVLGWSLAGLGWFLLAAGCLPNHRTSRHGAGWFMAG
jgi:hypothetical protein